MTVIFLLTLTTLKPVYPVFEVKVGGIHETTPLVFTSEAKTNHNLVYFYKVLKF